MEQNTIIIYLASIIFIFLIGRFLVLPLKSIVKLIGNSILGGILIFVVNAIGGLFGFHIGLNVVTALLTGILGVPRCYITYYLKSFYRLMCFLGRSKKTVAYKNIIWQG